MSADVIAAASVAVMLAIWKDLKTDIREIRQAVGLAPTRGRK